MYVMHLLRIVYSDFSGGIQKVHGVHKNRLLFLFWAVCLYHYLPYCRIKVVVQHTATTTLFRGNTMAAKVKLNAGYLVSGYYAEFNVTTRTLAQAKVQARSLHKLSGANITVHKLTPAYQIAHDPKHPNNN